jgi:hypothetical protein
MGWVCQVYYCPNQLQTTCENLWSIVAAGSVGHERRPVSPAFVGCISGLGNSRRDPALLQAENDRART